MRVGGKLLRLVSFGDGVSGTWRSLLRWLGIDGQMVWSIVGNAVPAGVRDCRTLHGSVGPRTWRDR